MSNKRKFNELNKKTTFNNDKNNSATTGPLMNYLNAKKKITIDKRNQLVDNLPAITNPIMVCIPNGMAKLINPEKTAYT